MEELGERRAARRGEKRTRRAATQGQRGNREVRRHHTDSRQGVCLASDTVGEFSTGSRSQPRKVRGSRFCVRNLIEARNDSADIDRYGGQDIL